VLCLCLISVVGIGREREEVRQVRRRRAKRRRGRAAIQCLLCSSPDALARLAAALAKPALCKRPRAAAAACVAVGPARGAAVLGRAGLADVLCLLCSSPDALARPAAALARPVAALLPKDGAGEVRRVDPRSR
jgi:hypothetical protein